MFCPNCGNEIRDGAKFCAYCGANVPDVETTVMINEQEQDQTISLEQEQEQNRPMFQELYQSQSQSEEQELYRKSNQQEFQTSHQTQNEMPPKKRNKTVIAIIAFVVVIALIIGSLLFVFRHKENDDSDEYDAEYTLNTYSVFSSKNIKDGKECEISIDSDDGKGIGKSYHVTFNLTNKKPHVQLNLVESVYVVSISYETKTVKHKLTTDKNCDNNLMTFDVEKLEAEPEFSTNGESFVFENNVEIYRPVLEEMQRLKSKDSLDKDAKYVDEELFASLKSGSESLYAFADIDKDGTSELIVGERITIDDTPARESTSIIAIFSEQDGNISRLLSSYCMTSTSIFKNGTILISISSGMALDNSWEFYKIAENQQELKEICRLHYNGESGEKFTKDDTTEISKSEFDSIFKDYVNATVDFNNYFELSSDIILDLSWKKLDDFKSVVPTHKPKETENEYTAVKLAQKSLDEIISIMGGKYKSEEIQLSNAFSSSGTPYIYNYDVLPGFAFATQGNDYYGISIMNGAKLNDKISSDMTYAQIADIVGDMDGMMVAQDINLVCSKTIDGYNVVFCFILNDYIRKNMKDNGNGKIPANVIRAGNPSLQSIGLNRDLKRKGTPVTTTKSTATKSSATKPQTLSRTESIKKEYKKILSKYSGNMGSSDYPLYRRYTVYYIDKDGIPELIIRDGNCEANYVINVYTYTTDIVYLGEIHCGHTCFYSIDNRNGMYAHYGHMGMEELSEIRIESGELIIQEAKPPRSCDAENPDYIYANGYRYLNEIEVVDYSYIDNIK